jgi:PleD family two-component response regulator
MSPRKRILLADENETDVETWKAYLSTLDCETKVATDNAGILDCLAQWRPNLVLLNPFMSTGSGFDICRQVKQNPATRKTMVLMVIQLNALDDIERAVEAETDDFLSKPVNKSEFLKRVENLLKLSHL